MELTSTQVNAPVRSWLSRAERRHPAQVDYFSELRSWVQHAILEAEEKKDLNKKGRLLNLLKDLQECPENSLRIEDVAGRKE